MIKYSEKIQTSVLLLLILVFASQMQISSRRDHEAVSKVQGIDDKEKKSFGEEMMS